MSFLSQQKIKYFKAHKEGSIHSSNAPQSSNENGTPPPCSTRLTQRDAVNVELEVSTKPSSVIPEAIQESQQPLQSSERPTSSTFSLSPPHASGSNHVDQEVQDVMRDYEMYAENHSDTDDFNSTQRPHPPPSPPPSSSCFEPHLSPESPVKVLPGVNRARHRLIMK